MVSRPRCSIMGLFGTICVLAAVSILLLSAFYHQQPPCESAIGGRRSVPGETPLRSSLNSDVSGYDVPEVSRWYSGSVCSGRGSEFVGDQPFFPPCRSDLPPGVATWGKYPYMGPFRYLNNSKNPCWKQNGEMKCIPYFYLIGVTKSATSDLFARIISHPDVVRTVKEHHFFDRLRYQRNQTFRDYVNKFTDVATVVQTDLWNHGKSNVISGDGSTSYFYDNSNWKMYSGNENCTEPRVILAHHLYHLNSHLKILMLLRHPVHRLYSRYLFDYGRPPWFNKNDPPSPRQFHSWVVDGLKKYRDCFQRWSLRHCVYNKTLYLSTHKLRIEESMYSVQLEDWFRVVPRDQFLFLRYDDYSQEMAAHLRRVFDFLGLDKLTDDQLQGIIDSRPHLQGQLAKHMGPMLPETERLLQEFYQPFIRRFAAMLHDNKFLWADVSSHGNKAGR